MSSQSRNPRTAGRVPPFPESPQPSPGSESRMRVRPDFGEVSYRGLGRLEGRVALVTGADSGIGRAVALAFAREGADVAIGYHRQDEDADETLRVVEESGRSGILVKADLADEEQCRDLVEETVDRFGRIDVLVNNAAYQGKAVHRFEDLDTSRVEHTFRVNVIAIFHLVRHALPHMRAGSSIINVSSMQAWGPSSPNLDYAASEGAIVTFTKGLARHLAERGIRVNSIAPGPLVTSADAPMGRPAEPVELAPAFVFLASDESRYVSGEVLGVTGGRPLA